MDVTPHQLSDIPADIEILLGEEGKKILELARSKKPADYKMRAICLVDKRCFEFDSTEWGALLKVSDAAIRKTEFWIDDRKITREANRAMYEHHYK